MEFHRWLSIENLYREKTAEQIFQLKEVICTEKIHGTNAQMGFVDGEFIAGSKNMYVDLMNVSDHQGFVNYALQFKEAIVEYASSRNLMEFVIYGEWYGSGVMKGIQYSDKKDFIVFAVKWGEYLVPYDLLFKICVGLNLIPPIVLYRGEPNQEKFDSIKGLPSTLGKINGFNDSENTAEGIVIASPYMHMNHFGEYIIAKHKDSKWEERASAAKRERGAKVEIPEDLVSFAEEFVTEVRLDHVKDSIRADGLDPSDPKNIGAIMKRMVEDVLKEGKEELLNIKYKFGENFNEKQLNKLINGATKKLLFK